MRMIGYFRVPPVRGVVFDGPLSQRLFEAGCDQLVHDGCYGLAVHKPGLESALAAMNASDVLVAPHHGSRTSSSAVFLDAVQPALVLVQSGYRNAFGHPAPVVLARYAERRLRVLASPACGAIHWRSTAPQAAQCERDTARRYWHHQVPEPSASP